MTTCVLEEFELCEVATCAFMYAYEPVVSSLGVAKNGLEAVGFGCVFFQHYLRRPN